MDLEGSSHVLIQDDTVIWDHSSGGPEESHKKCQSGFEPGASQIQKCWCMRKFSWLCEYAIMLEIGIQVIENS
jgi:hypothetical protein